MVKRTYGTSFTLDQWHAGEQSIANIYYTGQSRVWVERDAEAINL
jgi:hypothetical protein